MVNKDDNCNVLINLSDISGENSPIIAEACSREIVFPKENNFNSGMIT